MEQVFKADAGHHSWGRCSRGNIQRKRAFAEGVSPLAVVLMGQVAVCKGASQCHKAGTLEGRCAEPMGRGVSTPLGFTCMPLPSLRARTHTHI